MGAPGLTPVLSAASNLSPSEMTPHITRLSFFPFEKILQKCESSLEIWSYYVAQVGIKPIVFLPEPLNAGIDPKLYIFFMAYLNI